MVTASCPNLFASTTILRFGSMQSTFIRGKIHYCHPLRNSLKNDAEHVFELRGEVLALWRKLAVTPREKRGNSNIRA